MDLYRRGERYYGQRAEWACGLVQQQWLDCYSAGWDVFRPYDTIPDGGPLPGNPRAG